MADGRDVIGATGGDRHRVAGEIEPARTSPMERRVRITGRGRDLGRRVGTGQRSVRRSDRRFLWEGSLYEVFQRCID